VRRVAILLALAACGGGESVTETVTVSALRVPCAGEGLFMCLELTDVNGDTRREFFGIEGYTHRWGFEAEIRIRIEEVDDPPADGSSEGLFLDELISEELTAPPQFEIDFPDNPPGLEWFSGSGLALELVGTTAIECDQPTCDAILVQSEATSAFSVTMELTDDDQTLRAVAVAIE
jgi:hypothetical protein